MAPILSHVPPGLATAKHWVLRKGKKPVGLDGVAATGWQKSDFWMKYQEVEAILKQDGRGFSGAGFVIAREAELAEKQRIGIDLDACRDPVTGWVSPWALAILQNINSYSEITPSQTGFHIWLYGKLPDGKDSIYSEGQDPSQLPSEVWTHIKAVKPNGKRCNSLEIYEDGPRHFTVTGWFLEEFPMDLIHRQSELEQIINENCSEPEPDSIWSQMEEASRRHGLPKIDILKVIDTTGWERSGDQLRGPHPTLGSSTGHNVIVHPKMGCYAYMHNGLKKGGDAWTWLACETGLVPWEEAGKGSLGDPIILLMVKDIAVKKGLVKAEDFKESDVPLRFPISYDDHSLTDIGNSERLVNRHGKDMRFCQIWNKWIVWNGKQWKIDTSNIAKVRAIDTAKSIFSEAAEAPTKGKSREIGGWALVSASRGKIDAMLDLAKGILPVSPDELDQDIWLLNCLNGTLDLRPGKLHGHRREDFITILLEIEFDPNAKAPYWLAMLDEIFGKDLELIKYIQKALGYTLTGTNKEQIWFLCYGTGQNGKSTFINAILFVLGQYGMTAKFDSFQVQRSEGVRNDLADMKGRRIVAAIEAKQGRRLDETVLKQLTGEDRIRARHLYAEFEEFTPSHKLWLIANHRPTVHETTKAFWRRVRLIPFLVTIPDDKVDKDLNKKLESEAQGILAWMVEGCRLWQQEGLTPPLKVIEATAEYRDEMDILAGFLDDVCELTFDWNDRIQSGTLYEHYNIWCQNQRKAEGEEVTPINRKLFGMKLTERGLKREKVGGLHYWLGLKFKRPSSSEQAHLAQGNQDAETGSMPIGPLIPITSAIHNVEKECESKCLMGLNQSTVAEPMGLDGPTEQNVVQGRLTSEQKKNIWRAVGGILRHAPRKDKEKLGLSLDELVSETKIPADQIKPLLEAKGWTRSEIEASGLQIWWASDETLKAYGLMEAV